MKEKATKGLPATLSNRYCGGETLYEGEGQAEWTNNSLA